MLSCLTRIDLSLSFLTTDVKSLARVLATRLKWRTNFVHMDQSKFIPTRSTAQNLQRLFLNLQLPVGNRAIFSLEAAKAFDSFGVSGPLRQLY